LSAREISQPRVSDCPSCTGRGTAGVSIENLLRDDAQCVVRDQPRSL